MTASFMSEYLTKSEYLTRFFCKIAEVATRGPYAESSLGRGYHRGRCLGIRPIHFYKDFPYLIPDRVIVSMVGTTGAF
jgi:hypothetical protein